MKRFVFLFFILILFAVFTANGFGTGNIPTIKTVVENGKVHEFYRNQIVVKFETVTSQIIHKFEELYSVKAKKTHRLGWVTFEVNQPTDELEFARQIKANTVLWKKNASTMNILDATVNYAIKPAGIPNDPIFYREQLQNWLHTFNIASMGGDADITWLEWYQTGKIGTNEVLVLVTDTGILKDHEDLVGRVVADTSFIESEKDTIFNSHGTEVGGIIAANTNNGIGVASVTYDNPVKLLSAKILNKNGRGNWPNLLDASVWGIKNGAKIISMSLQGNPSPVAEDIVRYAKERDILIVAASGNSGIKSPVAYPAHDWREYDNVIAVGASKLGSGLPFEYSASGEVGVTVVAPGLAWTTSSINNPRFGPYNVIGGTSASAPMVSGLASLILTFQPDLKPKQIRDLITSNTTKIPGIEYDETGYDSTTGYGRINVYKTMKAIAGKPEFSVSPERYDFGEVEIEKQKETILTVINTGEDTLEILNVYSTEPDIFSLPVFDVTRVLPGNAVEFKITFQPKEEKEYAAEIVFEHNAEGSPTKVPVNGKGFERKPAISVSSEMINFGEIPIDSIAIATLTVTNTGDAPLRINNFYSTLPEVFDVSLLAGQEWKDIKPGQSLQFETTFTPKEQTLYEAHIVFEHNAEGSPTKVPVNGKGVIKEFSLSQNYPNPFKIRTKITFALPRETFVTLKVYNILGQEVDTLVKERRPAGLYVVNFDASGLANGIYFYRIQTDTGFGAIKKMNLIK